MNIKSIKILEKIISAGGSCDDRTPSDCKICPLGKSKIHPNGSSMGCIEALGIEGLPLKDANQRYLEAAMSSLADLKLDEILGEDDGVE